jgi:Protein of unknown function (DUF2442)
MTVNESDFEKANARMENRLARAPRAIAARFDAARSKIVIDFEDGTEFSFPPSKAQGLDGATVADLSEIDVSPAGLGLHWPQLDAGLYIPALLQGLFGTQTWMAQTMGKKGGEAASEKKRAASRANGKTGGRPRKRTVGAT